MDLDTIITFLFLLVFFVLPSILKQIQARKKKAGTAAVPEKKKKKPSIFNRMGEQIQQFIQELEKQAQQQKEAEKKAAEVWESFEDDQAADADFDVPEAFTVPKDVDPKKAQQPEISEPLRKQAVPPLQKTVTHRPVSTRYQFRSNPLQNAIIWSEILNKPVGLKDM